MSNNLRILGVFFMMFLGGLRFQNHQHKELMIVSDPHLREVFLTFSSTSGFFLTVAKY